MQRGNLPATFFQPQILPTQEAEEAWSFACLLREWQSTSVQESLFFPHGTSTLRRNNRDERGNGGQRKAGVTFGSPRHSSWT